MAAATADAQQCLLSQQPAQQPLPLLAPGYRAWTFDYLARAPPAGTSSGAPTASASSSSAPSTAPAARSGLEPPAATVAAVAAAAAVPRCNPSGVPLPSPKDWVQVFRKSIPTYVQHALQDEAVPEDRRAAAAEQFQSAFSAALDALAADPHAELAGHCAMQPLCTLSLCRLREECLHAAGFADIFKQVKDAENQKALQLLPQVLEELDTTHDLADRMVMAVRGVLAGNIFDLGAQASAEAYASGGTSFAATRAALLPRPWAVDQLDSVADFFRQGGRYRKAILFLDNAGPDAVLGMLPLARELLKMGTQVVLAANRRPVINDITAEELRELVAWAAMVDELIDRALQEEALTVVSSGNDMPVIDLSKVSNSLLRASAGCDLVVLEGMGRAIETNLFARFTCDSLKLGMIKHPEVAACLNGRMYDCVCKYDKAATSRRTSIER